MAQPVEVRPLLKGSNTKFLLIIADICVPRHKLEILGATKLAGAIFVSLITAQPN